MLDDGVCGTIGELARREKVTKSFMSCVLRLTLLALEFVEAMLDGRQPQDARLEGLLDRLPAAWAEQLAQIFAPPT